MNYIDQFINFVSTLYTPRRACTTLFMICGGVLSLCKILPLLHLLLTTAIKPIAQNYETYILLISLVIGVSLGIVVFSIVDLIVLTIYEHLISKKKKSQSELKAIKEKNIRDEVIFSNFKTAYFHLSIDKINIIRSLITFPSLSFHSEHEDVKFLEKSGRIEALTYISDEEKVYQLNQTIRLYPDDRWNEEVNFNTDHFHSFDAETAISIINAMSDVKIKAELDEFNFSFYKSDIEKCFEVSEFTETLYSLRFKERYEKKFSELHLKPFRSERLFSIKVRENIPDLDIPF